MGELGKKEEARLFTEEREAKHKGICFYLPDDIVSDLDAWTVDLKLNRSEIMERIISIGSPKLLAKTKRSEEKAVLRSFHVNEGLLYDEVRDIIRQVPKQREAEVERQRLIADWKKPEMQSWLGKFDEAIRKLKEKMWATQSSSGEGVVEGRVAYPGEE